MIKLITQNLVAVLLILGILVAVNYLGSQFSKRWDLTDEQEYTLAPSSIKILDRLDDRVTIKLFYTKDLPDLLIPIKERVSDLLQEFKAYSKQDILIEFIEPDLNEETEKETLALGIMPLELNVIKKDKRELVKAYMGMAIYYQDKKQVIPVVAQVKNLEYMIDLSLLKLTQKDLPKIGVYLGANQSKYRLIDQVVKQLGTLKIIEKDSQNLSEMGLTSLLIIDPIDVDVKMRNEWDRLIDAGVPVMLFAGTVDVSSEMKPEMVNRGIDDWLAKKGLSVSTELLLDVKQNAQAGFQAGMMQVYLPYPFWVKALKSQLNSKNIITEGLEDVLFPWTNVVQVFLEKSSPWTATTLVESSKSSFLQKEDEPKIGPQYVNDLQEMPTFKQYPLSVLLSQKSKVSKKLFVTATHHVLQDEYLQRAQGNVLFISNMIEFCTWGDYLIGVRSRGKTSRPLLEIMPSTRTQIKWGTSILTPLICVLLGFLFFFALRKRRQSLIQDILG